jgi:beta-lactam-binding protein with PASTA domain
MVSVLGLDIEEALKELGQCGYNDISIVPYSTDRLPSVDSRRVIKQMRHGKTVCLIVSDFLTTCKTE